MVEDLFEGFVGEELELEGVLVGHFDVVKGCAAAFGEREVN